MEVDKFPKGLNPLESSFSSSDVGKKETHKEEESKRKVGDTISLNIGTHKSQNIIKLGAQCSDEEKAKFTELLHEFQDVLHGHTRIFMVLIMLLYNMPFLSRKG
jgi:hypothetical protein